MSNNVSVGHISHLMKIGVVKKGRDFKPCLEDWLKSFKVFCYSASSNWEAYIDKTSLIFLSLDFPSL